MSWQFASQENIQYFQFVQGEYTALYSTITGQDSLIKELEAVFLKQIHSAIIIDVEANPERTGDGLIGSAERCLGIKIADCLPVYAFSRDRIAILHCGWRGIIAGIARQLKKALKDFHYLLGASIGPCCYEVKLDVAGRFKQEYGQAILKRDGKYYLDLKSAVIKDLGSEALLGSLDLCTKCHPEFFYSNRRGDSGRNFALIRNSRIDPTHDSE